MLPTDVIFGYIGPVVIALIASGGFWTFMSKRKTEKTANEKLLIGLAHDRITFLAGRYIERGEITREEYENLHDFLYIPYANNDPNGVVARLMKEVEKLPITEYVQKSPPER